MFKPTTKLQELIFIHNGTMRGIQDDFDRKTLEANLEISRQAAKEAWKMLKQAVKEKFKK